jgi:secreted trypsin-like serine protease
MKKHLCIAALVAMGMSGCAPEAEESSPVAPGQELGQDAREIIGGSAASANQFPWQARLLVNGQFNCGGSLIRPNWVLTAGHCVYGLSASQFTVILGDHRQSITESTEQSRGASRLILHPGYVHSTIQNDLALIELSSPVTLNAAVSTIPLQTANWGWQSDTQVSGWGRTSGTSSSSDVLRYVAAAVVDNSACNNASALFRDLNATELCAGAPGTGGCFGDSGGPLFTTAGVRELAGIVSWGSSSCNSYTVFTRVSSYVPWINDQIRKQVRISWTGNLSNGSIRLRCLGTGEEVSATVSDDGTSADLNCSGSTVEASCSTDRYIDTFERTVNGSHTYVVDSGYPKTASDTLFVNAGDKVDYLCRITD